MFLSYLWYVKRQDPPKPGFIYLKNCIFILTCLSFSHLQSTLHLMEYTYQDIFSHCSKQFLNSSFLMPFSASAIFCFTSSTPAKCFPLRIFSSRETKISHLGRDWVNRKVGTQGSCLFLIKNCWTLSTVWAGALVIHPPCRRQTCWKSLKKNNSLKLNTASHNNASWYTDTHGFLEHSSSRGSLYYKGPTLQKKIPVWGEFPPCILAKSYFIISVYVSRQCEDWPFSKK